MTTYNWSTLGNGAVFGGSGDNPASFNLAEDQIFFDDPQISAEWLVVISSGGTTTLSHVFDGKSVTLDASLDTLTSAHIGFLDGSQFLVGDNAANTLTGGAGADILIGLGGADSLDGGAGSDSFHIYTGGTGSYGNDTLNGGEGVADYITYFDDSFGVTVNLGNETAAGSATGGDGSPGSTLTLIGIEGAVGTFNADTFNANSATEVNGLSTDIVQWFNGLGGNDTLVGATGFGRLTLAEYTGLGSTGVVVNLQNGTASDGFGGFDTLINIDGGRGSMFNDTLIGHDVGGGYDEVIQFFEGMAGNDLITNTRSAYDNSLFGVVVNMSEGAISGNYYGAGVITVAGGTARDGWDSLGGGTDTLQLIDVRGSQHNDTLVGSNDADNWFEGLGGNDFIDGRGGVNDDMDVVEYIHATGAVAVNLGATDIDLADYGLAAETIAGGTAQGIGDDSIAGIGVDTLLNIEAVRGSDFDDVLIGGGLGTSSAFHVEFFEARAGDDTLDGGDADPSSLDVAVYDIDPSAVIVNLGANEIPDVPSEFGPIAVAGRTARDGYGDIDTLVGINGAIGSNFDDRLFGGDGDEWFQGNAGNDTIDGGGGSDTVVYDYLENAGIFVSLQSLDGSVDDGMGGTDILFGIENVWGTEQNDTLLGDGESNQLMGMAGNDMLNGAGGNDTVLYQFADHDVEVNLATGVATGDEGTDTLVSIESAVGGDFDDNLTGSSVANLLDGGLGIDLLIGGAGNDTLIGGGGDDSLDGGAGNDSLVGGDGVDTFLDKAGNDTLNGGAGNDIFNVDYAASTTVNVTGGSGRDTYVLGNPNAPVQNYQVTDFAQGNNGDLIDVSAILGASAAAGFFTGGTQDPFAAGILKKVQSGANVLIQWDLDGAGTAHTTRTGLTLLNETASLITNANFLGFKLGTTGNNTVAGSGGNDVMFGLGGNDTLNGGAGDDLLFGGTGVDSMVGGAGNDTYQVDSASDKVVEASNTPTGLLLPDGNASGTGLLDVSGITDTVIAAINYSVANLQFVENITLTGAAASATGNNLANVLLGNAGNDVLTGGGGNDTLNGGTGNDNMTGGGGNDTYVVDAAGDIVTEGANAGTDTVQSSVTRVLGTNFEHLTLTGSAAINGTGNTLNNSIIGNSGANNLNGGTAGNDTLNGGAGTDTLIGGAGNDTYVIDGTDVVTEGANAGTDTVQTTATKTLSGALANIEHLTLIGNAVINGTGNAFNNSLIGNSAINTLNGSSGNDTLNGGGGADSLLGGAGNDVLIWDAADVKVDGGTETDTLQVTGTTALDLTVVANTKIVNVEVINLAGTNTLTLAASDVLALSSTSNTVRVDGAAGDAVNSAGWAQGDNITIGAQTYAQYTKDGATLQVDLDIDRSGIAVAEVGIEQLVNGTNGFRLDGLQPGFRNGHLVSSAGDVNGDGFDDVIVGAPYAEPSTGDINDNDGSAYVVFGAAGGFPTSLELSALNGVNGFRIDGVDNHDGVGRSVAAGDVNGDGRSDLIIGAPGVSSGYPNAEGATYVIFGTNSGFASSLSVTSLDGANGFRLFGESPGLYSSLAVSSAGDVNGDGYDDILVGALGLPGDSYSGAAYVVFGKESGFASNLDLSALDGSNGFKLPGQFDGGRFGGSVSAAGDVNGDGFGDIVVGAYSQDTANGDYSGASYIIFGSDGGFASSVNPTALNGSNGFRIDGESTYDQAGFSVSAAGDVNGDGIGDLIIGARGYGGDTFVTGRDGASYVVFGSTSGFGGTFDLMGLTGSNGFRVLGEADFDSLGVSVSAAGDVNGDGYDDLVIGAPYADYAVGGSLGAAYVVFGAASGFSPSFSVTALDGTNGFKLAGADVGDGINDASDAVGGGVSGAGDINGDGFADLIIAADGANPDGVEDAGARYVVFGRDFNGVVDFSGSAGNDTQNGLSAAEVFVGGRGGDVMLGNGGADVFRGGEGNDYIHVGDATFVDVDGGSGNDTLGLGGNGMNFNLTQVADGRITGIEAIDLVTSGASSTLTLTAREILNLSDTSNTLTVNGDGSDTVRAGGGWTFAGTGDGFVEYTQGGATLRVDEDIELDIGVAASSLALSALDGANGFRLDGIDAGDFSGYSVASAGDVNGDGFADLIVGAQVADPNGFSSGESYVVFGKASGFGSELDLSALNGANGFRLDGIDTFDFSGRSVASAGDVNGDGYADLIVGARGANGFAGESYVVFGKASGFGSSLALGSLDGENGFRLDGIDASDRSGHSVASAGDVNGDGYDDLIVGAYTANGYAGESYVVFGKASGFGSELDLSVLDGTNGFRLDGIDASDHSGSSVASAGDVNGDGYDDLVVGAFGAYGFAGESYVVFGKSGGFGANLALSALNGTNGFRLDGIDAGDRSGFSVASAGDVNGDGYADLIVGAKYANGYAGESYVVFGRASGFGPELDLSALDGANGFRLDGIDAGDRSGFSVASAGDVNGDGYDDLIVGAPYADPNGNSSGESYVVFGRASGFGSALDLSALDGANGFRLDGIDASDRSGISVASAGDVNGDGYDDLVVGAYGANGYAGESYVVYGRDFNGVVDFAGTAGNDSLAGTSAAEVFVGGLGNDTLSGGGGADAMRGGEGDDRLVVASGGFLDVDGGSGYDTLSFSGLGLPIDLGAISDGRLGGIEAIDLVAGGTQVTLNLSLGDVLNMSDTSNTLTIDGDESDLVTVSDGLWVNDGVQGDYHVYTLGAAKLRIDTDIQLTISEVP